ncbi:MAG: response regulator [Vicinamibacterales bacterium]
MLNALIADSDPQSRFMLRRVLVGEWGLGIFESDTGMATLEQLAANAFRLLFLDVELPVLSGTQVLELIRTKPDTAAVPVVMTGRHVSESSLKRLLELDISDYLLKPLQPERLVNRLTAVVNRALGHPKPDRAPSWPSIDLSEQNALVVDGHVDYRTALVAALSTTVPAVGVSSGTDAIRAVGFQPPGLVFIGDDVGLLSSQMLCRKLLSLPASHAAYMVSVLREGPTGELDRTSGFHAAMPRHEEPAALRRAVATVVAGYEARLRLIHVLPELMRQVPAIGSEVFSMLMAGGVRVAAHASRPRTVASCGAIDVRMVDTGMTLRCSVFAESDALRPLAIRLGVVAPDDAPASLSGPNVLGESLQALGTRIANWVSDAGFRVERRMAQGAGPLGEVTCIQVTSISGEPPVKLFVEVSAS